jgi:hypothetical protein
LYGSSQRYFSKIISWLIEVCLIIHEKSLLEIEVSITISKSNKGKPKGD